MLWEFYDRLSCLPISWDYFIGRDLCGYGWNVYWFNNILHAISIHPCHTEKLSIIKRFRRIAFCYLMILSKTYIMYTSHISVFANTKNAFNAFKVVFEKIKSESMFCSIYQWWLITVLEKLIIKIGIHLANYKLCKKC